MILLRLVRREAFFFCYGAIRIPHIEMFYTENA